MLNFLKDCFKKVNKSEKINARSGYGSGYGLPYGNGYGIGSGCGYGIGSGFGWDIKNNFFQKG